MEKQLLKPMIIGALLMSAGVFFLIFNYNRVSQTVIRHHVTQRHLIALQISGALNEYFSHFEKDLRFLSAHKRVIHTTPDISMLLKRYYESNEDDIAAITRIDTAGRIAATYPPAGTVGTDVSYHRHNSRILKEHKPVISDVFDTARGIQAVAYAYPVFDGEKFKGAISALIPFQNIAKRFFDPIRGSEKGYPWVISEGGIIIYHPEPSLIGKSFLSFRTEDKEFRSVLDRMLLGERGEGRYRIFNRETQKEAVMHVAFYPLRIGDTFWSVAISTPQESDIQALVGHRWRMILTVFIFLGLVMGFIVLSIKTKEAEGEIEKIRNMEKALTSSKNYFQGIIDSSPSVLITLKDDYKVVGWNKAAKRLYAMETKPAKGRFFWDVFPYLKPLREEIKQAVDEKREKTMNGLPLKQTGRECFVNVNYFPIASGMQGGVIRIDDVTESYLMNRQVLQAQRMEVVGTLAGGLAHDFNNVLGGIEGTVSLAEHYLNVAEKPEKEKLMHYLSHLSKASHRASSVIDRLLSLAKMNKGERIVFDLNDALREIYEICKNTLDKAVLLDFQYYNTEALILGDYYQIEHMLLNLSVNAEHAVTMMRPAGEKRGGRLKIALKKNTFKGDNAPGHWVITVQDDGVGMDGEVKKKIFDPFFTTKEKEVGSGLGLIMVSHAVAYHGGTIQVESEPGEGTCFTITLPIYEGNPDHNRKKGEEKTVVRGEGRILVIDDEKTIRDISREMLVMCGYEALCARGGKEGLEIFEKERFTLAGILLDLSMPGMDGYETFLELKRRDPHVAVILLSGFKGDARIQKMMQKGAAGFLKKPFTMPQLSQMLAAMAK